MSAVGAALCGSGGVAPLSLTASPGFVTGSRSGPGSSVVTSSAAGNVVSGGLGPYTYAWTYVSGAVFTITSPTASSTTFSKSMSGDDVQNSVYRCTVTDSLGATATADTTVELTSSSGA